MDNNMVEPLDIRLYAHTDGKLYFCRDGKEGCTQTSAAELLTDLASARPYTARFYGTADQADDILTAARAAYEGSDTPNRVAVGSPTVLRRTKNTAPAYALECMLLLHDYPQRRGGWRFLTTNDWNLFQFLARPCVETLLRHPAWPLIVALTTRQQSAAALRGEVTVDSPAIDLLLAIEDVHWHHTQSEPDDCLAFLRAHLGCTAQNIGRWINCPERPGRGTARQRQRHLLLLLGLCFGRRAITGDSWLAPHVADSLAGDIFRTYRDRTKSDDGPEALRSVLDATLRAVVEFIHDYWRQETAPLGWDLFVPRYFLARHVRPDLQGPRLACLDAVRAALPPRLGCQPLEGHKMWDRG